MGKNTEKSDLKLQKAPTPEFRKRELSQEKGLVVIWRNQWHHNKGR